MKHIFVLGIASAVIVPMHANATPVPLSHMSGVITNNIASMQHAIMLNSFDNFDGSTAITMGDYSALEPPQKVCQPVYGKTYCDGDIYGDDSTALSSGRSGGETGTGSYNWFDWHHAQDRVKFNNFDEMESKYDLISFGFAGNPKKLSSGYSQFGGFGGVAIAREKSDDVSLSENGGYLGAYRAYHIDGFNITGAADVGLLFNDATSPVANYDLMNFWAGAALNATYNFVLDETFTLQPGAYIGYTWIYSDGYHSATGADLSIDSAHMFEVSPSMRALVYIVNGLYASVSGRYVFNFNAGGSTKIAGEKIPELDMGNYAEYGISIEKSIERFNFALSLLRQDGGRTGWSGGVQLRYIF